ncbi:hypothetical protein KPH14_001520 [Odynerus spinipes]|uniref:DNA-directed RNA polymerase I subunit RPA49 n=1 Tax=Odynerus spinipes TaxID=1348599 RepID=A0AAD9VTL4_9HYME|nr:hypothetical protein KPH14_001520 [Odynerus spinipes]
MKRLLEGVIDEVIVDPEKVKPIIVNFQNGELKDEEAKKMSCGLFYDQKQDKTLLALSNGQLVYKGYKPDNKQQLTQTMLVLHNKRTGKIRLVQAERWSVSAVLHKPVVDENTNNDVDKIVLLNKQFGSKKVKRRTEQFERMKININAVKEDLEKTVSNIEIDKGDLEVQVPDEYITNIVLPQCNRNATDVRDVYNVDDIVPEKKLETLYEKVEDICNSIEGKSKFFTHALRTLKSDPEHVLKIALLTYIETVGKWINTPIKDVRKRGIEICPYSHEINTHIIDTYSLPSATGRLRPTSMRDKAVIHCLILGLIISNFVLDLELFSTVLNNRVGIRKLTDLAKIIAAVPSKDDKKAICLKLPLPSQAAIIKKRRKKQS